MTGKKFIKVDFADKDFVKSLGAFWDSEVKCWYTPNNVDPIKLKKWWRYLDCPFEDKDVVRSAGAQWDKNIKKWFVPPEKDFDEFEPWWPAWVKDCLAADETETDSELNTINGQAGGVFHFWLDQKYMKSGGTSDVFFGYQNYDTDGGKEITIAVKFFNNDKTNTNDFTMFERELAALQKLCPHPNIVPLIDYGFDKSDNTFFIVTQYHSLTLGDLISSKTAPIEVLGTEIDFRNEHAEEMVLKKEKTVGQIWLENYTELLGGVLDGLVHAFDHGIMHRDLKPGNILLNYDETTDLTTPLLIDFGISNRSVQLSAGQVTLNDIRTSLYCPENTDEESQFAFTRDVYSWGVIAVEILTDEVVRNYSDLMRIFEDDIEPNFPKPIVEILKNCISIRPKNRPENVRVLQKLVEVANDKLRA